MVPRIPLTGNVKRSVPDNTFANQEHQTGQSFRGSGLWNTHM